MYDLRHTCASLLIAQGASVKAVQKQLGHKSATMTLDVYRHLWPEETERLVERMDAAHTAAVAERARAVSGPSGIVASPAQQSAAGAPARRLEVPPDRRLKTLRSGQSRALADPVRTRAL
jgi:Phage integrase family